VEISVLELRVRDFVVSAELLSGDYYLNRAGSLLNNLAEPRGIDFDVGFEAGEGDIEVGDPPLEKKACVVCIVRSRRPY